MSNHWKHHIKSFQGGCTSIWPMDHAGAPLLYLETFMTAAREIRAARHHWVKLKHPSLLKEKDGGKQALATSYHRNSFAYFAIGTSPILVNPFSTLVPSVTRSSTNIPRLKGTQNEILFCYNVRVIIFLYVGWIIQWFGIFLPFSANTLHSAGWTVPGHCTVCVTQPYMPSSPLLRLEDNSGQLECAGSLTASYLRKQRGHRR